jgi:murein DD-endopeptidase MepM/ murein hydrolase activator NlpD
MTWPASHVGTGQPSGRKPVSSAVNSLASLARATDSASAFAAEHRRGIVATCIALLVGCAAAAFAIAPLAPDAASLPRRMVIEAVQTEPVAPQLESLAAHEFDLSRSELTRSGDTAGTLLERLGVSDVSAVAFLRTDPSAKRLFEGRGGRLVQVLAGEDGRLKSLVGRSPASRSEQMASHFMRLTVARDSQGVWQATEETVALQSQTRLASGTIRSSLFAASDEARIPDAIAVQIAEIFAADIDMHRELRRGDTFSVVYEALTADGEPVPWNQGTGRVLATEFVNGGKTHQALWFRDAMGRGGYYDPTGQSKKRAFLASPMEFSRVSSGFAMRFHPLLQKWRAHLGVDYAAPTGTPVRAVGDGVVEFAGVQGGYGNVVQVKHSNERSTLYAHLSRIDVKKGQRLEQGQRVGAVGSTGWATGPHLHFEFRINGQHQDPLRIAKASEAVALAPAAKAEFNVLAQTLLVKLDVADTLVGARGRGE